jgi:hypothetical protein
MLELVIVKAITKYWGIHDDEPGAYPLQCCGAAGADMEAKGEKWGPVEASEAFAHLRRRSCLEVRREMWELCEKHSLPSPPEVVRFLAKHAARLEAEAAGFAGRGRE